MHEKFDKQKLLDLMRAEYEFVERTLALIPPERMDEPNVEGPWSVKDTIAHLTAWERANFRETHAQVVQILETFPEEGLFELKRLKGIWSEPPWRLIPGNTYEHYLEHLEPVRKWLSGAPQTKEHRVVEG